MLASMYPNLKKVAWIQIRIQQEAWPCVLDP